MTPVALMIRIDRLTKIFSKNSAPALDSVSFEVADGEIVGFVGLNGAGKTTTIRIAAGVWLPTSGSTSVDGHDLVTDKVEASRRIGWVPELPNFEPNATAMSLMEYFGGFYGLSPANSKASSAELLKSVGLEGAESKKLRTYSQGMKKRFSLAASMLGDPRNFLFDEVLNGLDPAGIHYFRSLMVDLKAKGAAVLLSSHVLVEVESIADRVVFIHKGKVIKTIARSDLAGVGGTVVRMVIRNVNEAALAYLRELGELRVENGVLFLASETDVAKLNSDLVKQGYEVTEFAVQKEGLEEYFLTLVGKAN